MIKMKSYQLISEEEAVEYIQSDGLQLNEFDSKYFISQGSVIAYVLNNENIILMPLAAKGEYPCMWIKDKQELQKYMTQDNFPVSTEYKSWLEINRDSVKSFRLDSELYKSALESEFKLEIDKDFLQSAEKIFNSLKKSNKRKLHETKYDKVYMLGLLLIHHLSKEYNLKMDIEKIPVPYSYYYYPYLVKNGVRVDVISALFGELKWKGEYFMFRKRIGLE